MSKRNLEDYKKQFENVSKEKIIEMNYELSKNLCQLENALNIIDNFIHKEDY